VAIPLQSADEELSLAPSDYDDLVASRSQLCMPPAPGPVNGGGTGGENGARGGDAAATGAAHDDGRE